MKIKPDRIWLSAEGEGCADCQVQSDDIEYVKVSSMAANIEPLIKQIKELEAERDRLRKALQDILKEADRSTLAFIRGRSLLEKNDERNHS